MIGRPGKWPWKNASLIVTALIATMPLSGIEALDPVDQQHRITMRQRRHHPLDVERTDGGAGRLIVHRRLAALRLRRLRCRSGAVRRWTRRQRRVERREHVVGDVERCAARERRADLDHDDWRHAAA